MLLRLPVSHAHVVLRQPAGAEDILMAEANALDTGLAVTLLSVLATQPDGALVDWLRTPVTDLEVALLRLRQVLLGDAIRSDLICARAGCGARVDLGFRVTDYLVHHAPAPARFAVPASDAPFWSLDGGRVLFRIPTVEDQLEVMDSRDRERALVQRCVRGEELAEDDVKRVEAALEALSPSLFSELEGACPECGELVTAMFDPVPYVLRELRRQAISVYGEVHLLASAYHWSEREILSLPRGRRARYVELAQGAGG